MMWFKVLNYIKKSNDPTKLALWFLGLLVISWIIVLIVDPFNLQPLSVFASCGDFSQALKSLFLDLYYALRLFAVSANDVEGFYKGAVSWPILLMSFLDTAFLAVAIVSLASERLIRDQLGRGLPSKDHIIILGGGSWGLHYALILVNNGINVIIVDSAPSSEVVETLIARRIKDKSSKEGQLYLVQANFKAGATGHELLVRVKAKNAKKIVTMLEKDGANIDAAYALRKILSEKDFETDSQPTIMLPVDDIRLATSLAMYKRFAEHKSKVEIRFFNIMQQAAVRHLMKHPPELYADIFDHQRAHFAIYGLGDLAINLIYVISQLCHYRTWDIGERNVTTSVSKVMVTIIDQDIEKAKKEMLYLFPNIEQVLEIEYKNSAIIDGIAANDYFLPKADGSTKGSESKNVPPVTQHFFCFKDETLSIRCAIKLRKKQMKRTELNTPIFVISVDARGLSRLIDSNCDDDEWPDNIFPLVVLSKDLTDDIYFSDSVETIAKSFNAGLGSSKDKDDEVKRKKRFHSKWGNLPSGFKHSSFFQAAYLRIRLQALGYDWRTHTKANEITNNVWMTVCRFRQLI